MLQTIRDRAQGWIAWAIVILISIPFALWGIQEYLGVGAQPVIASVNDREITESELDRRYQQFRSELRERLGSAYRPELFDDEQLRKQVLEDMIRSELILQKSGALGLHAGDQLVRAMIMNFPQFQRDGRFDQAVYERALRNQGLSSKAFEQSIRLRLVSNQLSRAIEASEFVTERELNDAIRLRDQKRAFSYIVLPLAEFKDTQEIPDADIEVYYSSRQDMFRVPEQTKVEYLALDAERIGAKLNPDEETLRGLYESSRDEFTQGEQRRASHILVAVAPDADQETAQAAEGKIEDALTRIQEGEDFSALAGEISDDPGSSQAGGDLGIFERGIMDPAFEHAAFSAQANKVVGPVRSRFGFHLIKVTEIKGGEIPEYEDQREIVLETYRRNEGERLFYEYAERLSDLSYENPDSLEPAAEALGLEIAVGDWMDRNGGSGVFAVPKAVAAAFSEDVLIHGNNSEAVEIGPQHVIVLRTLDHKKADVKSLADVRDEIVDLLRQEQAADKAREQGEALLKRLQAGETLEQIAAETGRKLEQSDYVRRDNAKLPVNLVSSVFILAKPTETQTIFGTAVLDNQDVALVALTGVTEGAVSNLDASALKNEQTALRRARGRDYFDHLVDNLRTEAVVELR